MLSSSLTDAAVLHAGLTHRAVESPAVARSSHPARIISTAYTEASAAAPNAAAALAAAEAKINMFAPLVAQISLLSRDEYLAWVHVPFFYSSERVKNHTCTPACAHACAASRTRGGDRAGRLFTADWMEPFSFTSWWVVPLVWLPVAAALFAPYAMLSTSTPFRIGACILTGIMVWTLIEYFVHRFVFHIESSLPDATLVRTAHFILHGVHHKIPTDAYRLVLPPALFAILGTPIFLLLRPLFTSVVSLSAYHAMFAAGIATYVAYDMVHYAQHHVRVSAATEAAAGITNPLAAAAALFATMKRYHMKHHYAGAHHSAFGITSTLWDHVFDTLPPEELS